MSDDQEEFLSSSLKDKKIIGIPYVDREMEKRLNELGLETATQMLAIFLLYDADEEYFANYLSITTECRWKQCVNVALYLGEWVKEYI
ncbi:hypothetical protein SNEBB_011188 [Seison nebaliae]|nr:hypothetical protein SNEBB_011188 [Seison nebaliae]